MTKTVARFLLERLVAWDVRRVFGYPGDGVNGLVSAFAEVTDLRFVQPRHEETAAFMACAHAKFTGEVGVCLATSGPGAIHLLNGLYDARMDHQPVVAIVGQQPTEVLGSDHQQEVDLRVLLADVARAYCQTLVHPLQARTLIDRALRIAIGERTVTCIVVPNDVQEKPMDRDARRHASSRVGVGLARPRVVPETADLRRAAEILNSGERVAMLVGAGALGATQEVTEVADLLGACAAKALLGKAVLPDDAPWVTGAIGYLGTKPSWDLMQRCDTLLMIGTGFPFPEFLPPEGRARGVQVDLAPRMLSLRHPIDAALVGDARETLRQLVPFLVRKNDRGWRAEIGEEIRAWWDLLERRAKEPADPVNPQLLFHELSKRLPQDAILCADSGTSADWYARHVRVRPTMLASLSGHLATMGCGVPYALGAKLAHPRRPVIAMSGDGAMQMSGNAELLTVAKFAREWDDPRFVVLVLHNDDLNLVTWEMRVLGGRPKFEPSQRLPEFSYADYAESLGLRGIKVETPDAVGPAWDEALASDRPVVIDARTDPDVPPLPPHVTVEQAKNFVSMLVRGDSESAGIVRHAWRQTFPRR